MYMRKHIPVDRRESSIFWCSTNAHIIGVHTEFGSRHDLNLVTITINMSRYVSYISAIGNYNIILHKSIHQARIYSFALICNSASSDPQLQAK
jgi:hypothetical protein